MSATLPASARPLQRRQVSCHCGAVRFAIKTGCPELSRCDCTIRRRKHATVSAGMA